VEVYAVDCLDKKVGNKLKELSQLGYFAVFWGRKEDLLKLGLQLEDQKPLFGR